MTTDNRHSDDQHPDRQHSDNRHSADRRSDNRRSDRQHSDNRRSPLEKAQAAVYGLLDSSGQQSELNSVIELVISIAICLNVLLIVIESLVGLESKYGSVLFVARDCFFAFFLVEYILRVWIADIVMQDRKHPVGSRIRYMLSLRAIIDLLALLPVLLGFAVIDFRIFRVLRLFRVVRLKSLRKYTDTLAEVVRMKQAQLMASVFILLVFMLTSAVIIYDLENQAQPEVFNNVLSGLWWSISAVTTIGYGDMYPITPAGRVFGSLMSIAGVFIMAVPVAILTSGFLESTRRDRN
jgi:voltage-gated potassium channel